MAKRGEPPSCLRPASIRFPPSIMGISKHGISFEPIVIPLNLIEKILGRSEYNLTEPI